MFKIKNLLIKIKNLLIKIKNLLIKIKNLLIKIKIILICLKFILNIFGLDYLLEITPPSVIASSNDETLLPDQTAELTKEGESNTKSERPDVKLRKFVEELKKKRYNDKPSTEGESIKTEPSNDSAEISQEISAESLEEGDIKVEPSLISEFSENSTESQPSKVEKAPLPEISDEFSEEISAESKETEKSVRGVKEHDEGERPKRRHRDKKKNYFLNPNYTDDFFLSSFISKKDFYYVILMTSVNISCNSGYVYTLLSSANLPLSG
jgi:hypothetical protein